MNTLKQNKIERSSMGQSNPNKRNGTSFFKRLAKAGRATAVAAALSFGTIAGPAGAGLVSGLATMSAPREARADPVTIQGITAERMQLDLPLDVLDSQTEPFRRRAGSGEVYNEGTGRYGNSLSVPGVTFLVSLRGETKRLDLLFPGDDGETNTTSADLTEFANQVRILTGRELNGTDLDVRIIVERGTAVIDGERVNYTTAYVLATDAQSDQIVSCANVEGPCLAHVESFYNNGSGGMSGWLFDPPASGQ